MRGDRNRGENTLKKLLNQWTEKLRHHRRQADAKFLANAHDKALATAKSGQKCMNCNVPLTGPYCHICGQKDDDLRRPFWTFLQALLDDIFSSDSRLIKSLILLVLVPGGLTRAYVQGRRAAFVPPIRAYLVMSIVFFLALELTDLALIDLKVTPKQAVTAEKAVDGAEASAQVEEIDLPDSVTALDGEDAQKTARAVREDIAKDLSELSDEERAKVEKVLEITGVNKGLERVEAGGNLVRLGDDSLPYDINFDMFVKPELEGRIGLTDEDLAGALDDDSVPEWAKAIVRGFSKALVDPLRMNEVFNKWLPRVLILIVPIFALLLRFTHWGPKQFYFNQLMFSLHYHTFLFLLMTALIIIVPRFGGEIGLTIFFWGSMLYMFISLKIAQEQGWIKAFFKFCLLWIFYVSIMFTGLFTAISFGLQEI